MSFGAAENMVISDKALAEYEAWLKKFKEHHRGDEFPPLFSMTQCRLLAASKCPSGKTPNCASCEPAKETFRWFRNKLGKLDKVLYVAEPAGPAYDDYPGLGKLTNTNALQASESHTLTMQIYDGAYNFHGQPNKDKKSKGMVTISVS